MPPGGADCLHAPPTKAPCMLPMLSCMPPRLHACPEGFMHAPPCLHLGFMHAPKASCMLARLHVYAQGFTHTLPCLCPGFMHAPKASCMLPRLHACAPEG